jgi:acyl carrier protein
VERALVEIWAQLLRVDQVGINDNFFELGGHSLLATQVVVRLQTAFSVEVPMKLLFERPTIESLSTEVDRLRREHFLNDIESGGGEMEMLLETIAAMPESEARALAQQLRARERT